MEKHTHKKKKKKNAKGTSLNTNKGRSGRRRTVRTNQTIEVFRLYVQINAKGDNCKRNGLDKVTVLLTK